MMLLPFNVLFYDVITIDHVNCYWHDINFYTFIFAFFSHNIQYVFELLSSSAIRTIHDTTRSRNDKQSQNGENPHRAKSTFNSCSDHIKIFNSSEINYYSTPRRLIIIISG